MATELENRLDVSMVDQAIQDVLFGGQSYTLHGRTLTRANLTELRALRDQLLAESQQGNGSLLANAYVSEFLPR